MIPPTKIARIFRTCTTRRNTVLDAKTLTSANIYKLIYVSDFKNHEEFLMDENSAKNENDAFFNPNMSELLE